MNKEVFADWLEVAYQEAYKNNYVQDRDEFLVLIFTSFNPNVVTQQAATLEYIHELTELIKSTIALPDDSKASAFHNLSYREHLTLAASGAVKQLLEAHISKTECSFYVDIFFFEAFKGDVDSMMLIRKTMIDKYKSPELSEIFEDQCIWGITEKTASKYLEAIVEFYDKI